MAEGRDASTSDSITDSFPLLESSAESNNGLSGTYERPSTASRRAISRAFNLIRRTSGRRMMREPSVLVRETAAEHLEERQNEWAYSKPIVILDLIWNLTFVIVASVVLLMSIDEKPSHPLRIWILGYALQCCIHVACVWFEYSRRLSTSGRRTYDPEAPSYSSSQDDLSYSRSYSEQEFNQDYERVVASRVSLAKRIESANTSLSFIWWVLGFYWATTEDQSQNAPLLFWLCAAFLAFDVFFVVFCVSLACIIGVAVCCCLPCILAVMHRMAEQKGASEDDIEMLPKYRFQRTGSFSKTGDITGPFGGVMTIIHVTPGAAEERFLPAEDAECCICLSSYDDGVEVHELPCGHHFHCVCIERWLRMNSTCPLCKFDIVKDRHSRRHEQT